MATTSYRPTPDHPDGGPFSPRGKVRGQVWQVPMQRAVDAAGEAGFRPTTRSTPARVVMQRDWRTAATLTETPGGVVVKPAWTTAQLALVAGILVLLFVGLCAPV